MIQYAQVSYSHRKQTVSKAAISKFLQILKMSTNISAIPETNSSQGHSLFVGSFTPPRHIRLLLHEEPSPIEELNHCRDSDELVTGVSYGKLQWILLLYIIMLLILTLAHRCFKEP